MFKKKSKLLATMGLATTLSVLGVSTALAATYATSTRSYTFSDDVNFSVRKYVTYSSNSSSALDVDSLAAYIVNSGDVAVEQVDFRVTDSEFDKDTFNHVIVSVQSGRSLRVEADWWDVCQADGYDDTIFSKNDYVYTDVTVGVSDYLRCGWETFWYASNRSTSWHE